MTDKQKLWTKISVSVIAVLAIGGLFIHGHSQINQSSAQLKHAENHVNTERLAYNRTDQHVSNLLFGHATSSKDPIIRSVALNRYNNSVYTTRLIHFFNVYYNWNSLKSYEARPRELKDYATNNVLKNKKLFDSGKDKNGGDYIDNVQLNSQFSNMNTYVIKTSGNNIKLIADIQYNSWHTDTDNQGTGETWFNMTYNTKQHKITSMNQLFNNPSINNSSNADTTDPNNND